MGHLSAPLGLDPDTLCAGLGIGGGDGEPLVTPLIQSTTFCRDKVGSNAPHQYSRVSNPTVAALERALGALRALVGSVDAAAMRRANMIVDVEGGSIADAAAALR